MEVIERTQVDNKEERWGWFMCITCISGFLGVWLARFTPVTPVVALLAGSAPLSWLSGRWPTLATCHHLAGASPAHQPTWSPHHTCFPSKPSSSFLLSPAHLLQIPPVLDPSFLAARSLKKFFFHPPEPPKSLQLLSLHVL